MPGSTTPLTSWARELPSHPGPRATLAPRDEAFSTADARRAILAATGSPGAEDYVTRCTYDAFNWRLTETTPTSQALPWRPRRPTLPTMGQCRRGVTGFGRLAEAATRFRTRIALPPGSSTPSSAVPPRSTSAAGCFDRRHSRPRTFSFTGGCYHPEIPRTPYGIRKCMGSTVMF